MKKTEASASGASVFLWKIYCDLSWKLQETITFEMAYMGKSLLISIKPWFEEEEKEVIIGTVIDMTGVHDEPPLKQLKKEDQRNVKIVM